MGGGTRRMRFAPPHLIFLLLSAVAAGAQGRGKVAALRKLIELANNRSAPSGTSPSPAAAPPPDAMSDETRDPDFNPPQSLLDEMRKELGTRFSNDLVSRYLRYLLPAVTREPRVPLRNATAPEVRVDCSGPLWRGRRSTPARVVDLYSIAYETDLLEIRLLELDGLVDLTVLTESTYTHRMARKPLIMPHVWHRFERWRNKIMWTLSDDAQMHQSFNPGDKVNKDDWRNEGTMRVFPWDRYLKAIGGIDKIPPGTLHLHGDLDGIPSRTQIAHFKYCTPSQPLPAILLCTNLQHNFRVQNVAAYGGQNYVLGVFEAQHVAANGGGMPWRRHHKGVRQFNKWPGWDITRGHGPYNDAFKELSIAEGGTLPVPQLLKDPSLASRWHQCGVRTCCPQANLRIWNGPVPWAVPLNRARWPHLWPPEERVKRCPALWNYWKTLPDVRNKAYPEPPVRR
eukprot:TRINITY_DN11948_c0_g1_i2.p1 TRINITY_DN11948_c0_g1~~TRINITY_DN11948_c0_g1_i2.p1  ORF type:complete len:474 (+),score=67.32 TRINITY_DN11948_c0_g1_i2:62-1423(+)